MPNIGVICSPAKRGMFIATRTSWDLMKLNRLQTYSVIKMFTPVGRDTIIVTLQS